MFISLSASEVCVRCSSGYVCVVCGHLGRLILRNFYPAAAIVKLWVQ